MGRFSRGLKHMWNAFSYDEQKPAAPVGSSGISYGGSSRPHQVRIRVSNERSIISSIYSRLAVDVASAEIKHVRVQDDKYVEDMDSGLNECLTVQANIDQTPQSFMKDYVLTLCDKGVAAIVPVETDVDPNATGSWDVRSMRVGEVVQWFPRSVRVRIYDDRPERGIHQEITLPKSQVALIENPFYTIMNEPNSTFQRLIHKLNLLDSVDEAAASGKLDVIVQVPYTIKSEARAQHAEQRRNDIEFQLRSGKHGVAYIDGSEKVTQLNRPGSNTLMDQVEYLQKVMYDQLGLTAEILNGTADEATMLNYNSRVVKAFLDAFQQEMIRKFLTKTARTQGQTIMFFKNPFELMPISQFAEVSDVLSRNEIASPNELRMSIGMKPSKDPAADKLQNSNMPSGTTPGGQSSDPAAATSPDATNAALDEVSKAIDDAFSEFDVSGGSDVPQDG